MVRKVLVVMTDGTTIEGVERRTFGNALKIEQATIHTKGDAVQASGYLLISPDKVLWVQVEKG